MLYILGLDNCKVSFYNARKNFTKVRAIKRGLEQIMSRRTLANMTGKRYAALIAPGDHWVHWPDHWFKEVRKTYDSKIAHRRLLRRHILCFKNRGNRIVMSREVS